MDKYKYAISYWGGFCHYSNTVTDYMRHYVRVNTTAKIVRRSKSRFADDGWIDIRINSKTGEIEY